MTKQELIEFRRKLVKAKGLVRIFRARAPLVDVGIELKDCRIIMLNGVAVSMDAPLFYNWCYSVPLKTVRLMYDNSIADLDERIAKLKG